MTISLEEPNKEALYGEYLNHQRWADNLYRKAAHKSLDIPDHDDMQINTDNRTSGASTLQLLSVLALGGLLGGGGITAGVIATQFLDKPEPAPAVQSTDETVELRLGRLEEAE